MGSKIGLYEPELGKQATIAEIEFILLLLLLISLFMHAFVSRHIINSNSL